MKQPTPPERLRLLVSGAVQGVGFRPFVYRLAGELGLSGSVLNSSSGVMIEVEGPKAALDLFVLRLSAEKPGNALVNSVKSERLPATGASGFTIETSLAGTPSTLISPDLAVCAECAGEVADPADRRYRYPFTNCTNCGPRYSIVLSLPYDRPNTTMRGFAMCPDCRSEYEDPRDRRFHAQPVACPRCGPEVVLWDSRGNTLARREEALSGAANALLEGSVLALKGLGGFQLLVRADAHGPVSVLRDRKRRPSKPLALLVGSLAEAESLCFMENGEREMLSSPASPITLMRRRGAGVSELVAPGSAWLGVMLPSTPLHLLLASDTGVPLVATSGNAPGEPICIDENEALEKLRGVADLFLVHNRPIARQVDDSVAAWLPDGPLMLRRARGYAPLPVRTPGAKPGVLAVGGHLACTGAVSLTDGVVLSQHIGDLETVASAEAHAGMLSDLRSFFGPVSRVVRDLHPDYASTARADAMGLPVTPVQHHFAHVLGCMAENHARGPVLGVAWDGVGIGTDLRPWGGEFLLVREDGSWERAGHLRPFPLPGGDAAALEPRRSALGLLWEMFGRLAGEYGFRAGELAVIERMLSRAVNSPRTTSAGRLFDAVACLAGVASVCSFRGEAPALLESLADGTGAEPGYPMALRESCRPVILDWEPMVHGILADIESSVPPAVVSRRFHEGLADCIMGVARNAGVLRVALTGGCFSNRLLTTLVMERLSGIGFLPLRHRWVPPGDGGLSLGQAAVLSLFPETWGVT
jgi:hydrogenase maturation protein HypF